MQTHKIKNISPALQQIKGIYPVDEYENVSGKHVIEHTCKIQ